MPKLPKGMFRRKGRPGWYVRLFRGGRERWQSLGSDFAVACDRARALMADGVAEQSRHRGARRRALAGVVREDAAEREGSVDGGPAGPRLRQSVLRGTT